MKTLANLRRAWISFPISHSASASRSAPCNILFCFLGALIGTLVGVLPGIGPVATLAILLPVTFYLPPVPALIMLAGIYYGAQYGGSTTAILVNMPGEASSLVTCLDGHAMAKEGRAGSALATAALGSFFAGTVATIFIAVASPPLSRLAFEFGAAEYFSLMVLGLIGAVVLASGSLWKAVPMVLLGLLLGLVGTDTNSGLQRYTFGIPALADGIGFVPIAMGLLGITEIINNLEQTKGRVAIAAVIGRLMPTRDRVSPRAAGGAARHRDRLDPRRAAGRRRAVVRVCVLCGREEGVARALAVRQGRDRRRGRAGIRQQCRRADLVRAAAHARPAVEPDHGGDGRRDDHPGHLARAAGDDAAAGIVLGDHRQHVGRQPHAGDHQPAADRLWVRLLNMPYRLLFPAILLVCCIGVYSLNSSAFDVGITALFGVLGYVFYKLGCEPAPFALGFVLGPLMEENLRRAMLLSGGDPMTFVTLADQRGAADRVRGPAPAGHLPAFQKTREEAFKEG